MSYFFQKTIFFFSIQLFFVEALYVNQSHIGFPEHTVEMWIRNQDMAMSTSKLEAKALFQHYAWKFENGSASWQVEFDKNFALFVKARDTTAPSTTSWRAQLSTW